MILLNYFNVYLMQLIIYISFRYFIMNYNTENYITILLI